MKTIGVEEQVEQQAEPIHPAHVSASSLAEELRALRVLVEADHKILLSLRRAQRVSTVFSVLKLIIFLVPLIAALVFLPALIEQMSAMWDQLQAINQELGSGPSLRNFDFDSLRGFIGQ